MNNGNARRSRADRNICPDWVTMSPYGIGPKPRGFSLSCRVSAFKLPTLTHESYSPFLIYYPLEPTIFQNRKVAALLTHFGRKNSLAPYQEQSNQTRFSIYRQPDLNQPLFRRTTIFSLQTACGPTTAQLGSHALLSRK